VRCIEPVDSLKRNGVYEVCGEIPDCKMLRIDDLKGRKMTYFSYRFVKISDNSFDMIDELPVG
jgi:hypothetical protein